MLWHVANTWVMNVRGLGYSKVWVKGSLFCSKVALSGKN
ncbi:hypothetical protein POD11_16470 [Acinetobacter sp. P1(2023)]|nr:MULTISPECIES: hypothetical protein [unclassified Acinetobacter]MCU4531772.1 hypothetical protein [Acinetobacter sp. WU_MDCI_Abxe169]MDC0843835.1 hypothetical protein [Acinetobacter sp. P1(2023)]